MRRLSRRCVVAKEPSVRVRLIGVVVDMASSFNQPLRWM